MLKFLQFSTICTALGLLTGCADVRLIPPELSGKGVDTNGKGELSLSEPGEYQADVKILFVVDKSGSNAGISGTDNNATKRAGNIKRFYDKHKTDEFKSWGMLYFQMAEAKALIHDGDENAPTFTQDELKVNGAIENLKKSDSDKGNTPYGAALALTMNAISKDIDTSDTDSTYIVVFMSDGVPTSPNLELDGQKAVEAVLEMVRNLINISPNRIFLSTGFYGKGQPRRTDAIDLMRRMAAEGKGKFTDFENSQDWNLDELANVGKRFETWGLKQFLVYNLNASPCKDHSVDADSDGDGLCDKDEIKMGSDFDPANRFTTNATYSDLYVHYMKLNGKDGSFLPTCRDSSDVDYDGLNACEEKYFTYNQAPSGFRKRMSAKDPDTDFDGILDGIEFNLFFDSNVMIHSLMPANLLSFYDNERENARRQIEQHRSPVHNDSQNPSYDTLVTTENINGRMRLSFSQNILPLYPTKAVKGTKTLPQLAHEENENVILVYYIETPNSNPTGPGRVKMSFQKIKYLPPKPGQSTPVGLKVNDQAFTINIQQGK